MPASSVSSASRSSTAVVATIGGIVLQLAMVLAGHAVPAWRALWGPGGMLISLVVGVWAAWFLSNAAGALLWGAVAGGLGALIGIALAFALGDVPVTLLALGTAGSTVAGLVGAMITYKLRAGTRYPRR